MWDDLANLVGLAMEVVGGEKTGDDFMGALKDLNAKGEVETGEAVGEPVGAPVAESITLVECDVCHVHVAADAADKPKSHDCEPAYSARQ